MGAFAEGGASGDIAAEDAGEPAGDDESEPSAAEFSGGAGVGLGEGLEEGGELFVRETDAGVDDFEDEAAFAGGGFGADEESDGAGVGEFDCIAEKVGEDLAEARGVGEDGIGGCGGVLNCKREFFGVGAGAYEVDAFRDDGGEWRGDLFELDAFGFDFGEIEDVVDEVEEMAAIAADGVDEGAAFVGCGVAIFEEIGVTEDGGEGCADFVGHVGEELAFGGGGVLRSSFALRRRRRFSRIWMARTTWRARASRARICSPGMVRGFVSRTHRVPSAWPSGVMRGRRRRSGGGVLR